MSTAPRSRPAPGVRAAPTGSADLPLHGGTVPPWLRARMERLARVIAEAIVHHHGRAELLRRLAHPFWFQAFGSLIGMDWHSSGVTTTVVGALKRGLAPVERELGIRVCGGRGRASRRTPDELAAFGERTGRDGAALAQASRLVAKVDTAAVQDGFDLYLHAFVVTDDGDWTVVQQGMNGDARTARRYHWLSEGVRSFVEEPHAAIDGRPGGEIVNLTDRRASLARRAVVELVAGGPDAVVAEVRRLHRCGALPTLALPARHRVAASDVVLRRLHGAVAAAAARGPEDFQDLLLVPGVGARTVLSLALAAEVVHGTPARFSDPARFSLAHGGKDARPFPVPVKVYDETLRFLRGAVDRARLGDGDRLAALRRLDAESRRLERFASGEGFDAFVARENAESWRYGGRSVFGPARSPAAAPRSAATSAPTPTATPTPAAIRTRTPTAMPTPSAVRTAAPTATPTPAGAPTPTPTATPTPAATRTPTPTATPTPAAARTPTRAAAPTRISSTVASTASSTAPPTAPRARAASDDQLLLFARRRA
jgi:hypothetical protein